MAERILILGSNSFSGSHFVDYALEQEFEVVGISRSAEADEVFLPYKSSEHNRFQFYSLDLNHHLNKIMGVINEFKPDYIVNFSAQGMVGESWDNPQQWLATNFTSAVRLHTELLGCSFLKRFVQISTPEVYGNCSGVITEDAPLNPSTPYAVSKAACDMSLKSYYMNYGFPVITTRAANVYGPGQQLYRIIPRTILFVRQGKSLPLHGGGHSVRSFIHINDVAEATMKIMQSGTTAGIYHIATNRCVSIRELVEMICTKMNVNFNDFTEIVDDRQGKDAEYRLDSNKIRTELAWADKVDLETGIEQTIAWVDDNFNKLKDMPSYYIHKP